MGSLSPAETTAATAFRRQGAEAAWVALLVVIFVGILAAATGWWRLDLPISHTKSSDWDYQLTLLEAVGQSWRAGLLPTWNPWTAGGAPLLGNPESPALHPLGIAAALWHPAAVTRVGLLVHMGLLAFGSMLLARRLGAPAWSLVVVPAALLSTDALVWRLAHGHPMMVQAAWIPLAMACVLGRREGRSATLAGLCIAGAAHGGGHYPAWMAAAGCGLLAAGLAVARREPRWLRRLALAGVIAALVAAPKLWAVVVEGAASARLRGPQEPLAMGDYSIVQALGWIALDAPWWELGEAPGLHEGQPSWHSPWWLAAGLLGVWRGRGLARAVGAVALVAGLVSLGHNLPVNVFGLLHGLPPLDRFRNPERWALVWVPLVAALGAVGLGTLRSRWAQAGALAASLGVAAVSLGPATARTDIDQITEDAFQRRPLPPGAGPTAVAEPWRTNLESIGRGERCLDCSDAMMVEAPPGLALGPWRTEPAVEVVRWEPGLVELVSDDDAVVTVPEAWGPGWAGTRVGPGGRVVAELRGGETRRLRYWTPGLGWALGAMVVGLGLAAVLGVGRSEPTETEGD